MAAAGITVASAGTGQEVAFDKYGDASPPTTDQRVQWVGITAGTTGALAPVSKANSVPTVPPDDVISVTPTIDTNIYAAGDAVGGKQTLTGACRISGGIATLESLVVVDKGNQKANLTILFFDSDPSAATITNNAAFVYSTDISKLIGRINIATADYETIDSEAIGVVRNIGLKLKASGSAILYAAVVLTSGTPTYTATSDLIFKYGFDQG